MQRRTDPSRGHHGAVRPFDGGGDTEEAGRCFQGHHGNTLMPKEGLRKKASSQQQEVIVPANKRQ